MNEVCPLGLRVRELRTARGWSAQKLSDHVDGAISRCSISDLETGRKNELSLQAGVAIAHAFGITAEMLVDESVPPTAYVIAHEICTARERLAAHLEGAQDASEPR